MCCDTASSKVPKDYEAGVSVTYQERLFVLFAPFVSVNESDSFCCFDNIQEIFYLEMSHIFLGQNWRVSV